MASADHRAAFVAMRPMMSKPEPAVGSLVFSFASSPLFDLGKGTIQFGHIGHRFPIGQQTFIAEHLTGVVWRYPSMSIREVA